MVGIPVSFWDGLFSGAMLVSGRVYLIFTTSWTWSNLTATGWLGLMFVQISIWVSHLQFLNKQIEFIAYHWRPIHLIVKGERRESTSFVLKFLDSWHSTFFRMVCSLLSMVNYTSLKKNTLTIPSVEAKGQGGVPDSLKLTACTRR